MKILIIEDEPALLETVRRFLEGEKYIVENRKPIFKIRKLAQKFGDYDYDCILLDIMLPNGSGIDILKEIRRLNKKDAVIILSAKDAVEDKVLGLDLGADDYLAKPFQFIRVTFTY
ncbi:Transcriptional regulatory protein ciaR (fragment) [Capnocytophaga canimorsus]